MNNGSILACGQLNGSVHLFNTEDWSCVGVQRYEQHCILCAHYHPNAKAYDDFIIVTNLGLEKVWTGTRPNSAVGDDDDEHTNSTNPVEYLSVETAPQSQMGALFDQFVSQKQKAKRDGINPVDGHEKEMKIKSDIQTEHISNPFSHSTIDSNTVVDTKRPQQQQQKVWTENCDKKCVNALVREPEAATLGEHMISTSQWQELWNKHPPLKDYELHGDNCASNANVKKKINHTKTYHVLKQQQQRKENVTPSTSKFTVPHKGLMMTYLENQIKQVQESEFDFETEFQTHGKQVLKDLKIKSGQKKQQKSANTTAMYDYQSLSPILECNDEHLEKVLAQSHKQFQSLKQIPDDQSRYIGFEPSLEPLYVSPLSFFSPLPPSFSFFFLKVYVFGDKATSTNLQLSETERGANKDRILETDQSLQHYLIIRMVQWVTKSNRSTFIFVSF
ncbi:hypothetical protein RFI_08666 [Reticulomyxa filosa]|uniref:Uncharacterized protein n=1 Tax=Reticulomyxa filosa TaxID=46433 RepID=X6NR41_RETFI|nr:hypothetical protein RFI_08666 [Reticulomyxa filosa]|eukprot:ETO28466.1 hypothetical protein RFI_08666 [Reticulomyxa filosa]